MAEYAIEPQNTYNMDEKGFMIGILTKSKRIFTKKVWERGKLRGSNQDGNREWITLLASICADSTALPPLLIYKADTNNLQDTWVQDFDAEVHTAHFASSPSGWTNNKIGLAWLNIIFDRYTKNKARKGRDWRMLICNGHGSHLNMEFIETCEKKRILLAIFPLYATHRLQPLDVSLFSSLAMYYSQELERFIYIC